MALRKSSEHRSLTDCMQSMNLKCFRKRNMMFNDSWHSRRDPSIKDPRSNAAHDHFFWIESNLAERHWQTANQHQDRHPTQLNTWMERFSSAGARYVGINQHQKNAWKDRSFFDYDLESILNETEVWSAAWVSWIAIRKSILVRCEVGPMWSY